MIPLTVVHVREGSASQHTLDDVEGALRFLVDRWPAAFDGSDIHEAAIRLGVEVLEDEGSIEMVRVGLIAAAREADILDEDFPSNVVPLTRRKP